MPRASHLVLLLFTLFNIVYNKQPKFPKPPIYCISSIFDRMYIQNTQLLLHGSYTNVIRPSHAKPILI